MFALDVAGSVTVIFGLVMAVENVPVGAKSSVPKYPRLTALPVPVSLSSTY